VQGFSGAPTVRGGSHLFLLAAILIAIAPAEADPGSVRVTTTPIDFGRIYAGAVFTGIGTVTVTAPAGVSFKVAWGGGFHYSAGSRHLKRNNGAEMIPYSLYRDAGCTLATGDADLGDTYPAGSGVAGTGNGRDVLITTYARLMVPGQAPPGLYVDSIMVSVLY
jgi:spore coat protein U-like protein